MSNIDSRLAALARARGKPRVYLNPAQKFARKATRQSAINAKCFDCEGEDADTGWKWKIGNCPATVCPLWPYRPFRNMAGKPAPQSMMTDE